MYKGPLNKNSLENTEHATTLEPWQTTHHSHEASTPVHNVTGVAGICNARNADPFYLIGSFKIGSNQWKQRNYYCKV